MANKPHAWTIVQACGSECLAMPGGLLANSSMDVRKRMQRIQDSATHLVCSEPARSHAAPLLHRLPVHKRIMYKMFDDYRGTAP